MIKKFAITGALALMTMTGASSFGSVLEPIQVEASTIVGEKFVSDQTINVAGSTLNVRASHSATAKKITALKHGTQVKTESKVKNKDGSTWAYISSGNTKGWVNMKYLTPTETTTAVKTTSTSSSVKANASASTTQKVVDYGKKLGGIKYVWGGTSTRGFDCSGFTQYVFKNAVGKKIPRTAASQHAAAKKITHAQAQPGDLVFFAATGKGKATHVAIYAGNNKLLHATSSRGVTLGNLYDGYWNKRVIGFGRI